MNGLRKLEIPKTIAFLLGFWLVLLCAPVLAEDITLDWTNPTEQESCAPSGPTTIDGVNIWLLVATTDFPLETYTFDDIPPGEYTYTATAFNASGESRNSGHKTKTVTEFVTVEVDVYYPIAQPNSVLMLPIGTVPLGTACNPDININGRFPVDRALVDWAGTAEPLLVVAECG